MNTLTGWGRLPEPGSEFIDEDLETLTRGAVLSRGMGRSYGDSSLPANPADRIVNTRLGNRIRAFDPATGIIRTEAGLTLVDLVNLMLPRGWFPPVVPGTKFVTVGGMVASDVHGKNHHREGCFGAHVRLLRIRLADDNIVECSPERDADLFYGSIGGMGLLGHILEVEFVMHRIPSQWIWMERERAPDINAFLDSISKAAPQWPMTMGWIDCVKRGKSMGRGVLMVGRWASAGEAPSRPPGSPRGLALPIDLPNWALNHTTAGVMNAAIYSGHALLQTAGTMEPDRFFFPLDAILEWNRAYGSRGFTQYQCVVPRAAGAPAVREFMERLTRLGAASPLCVIKDCGPEGQGVLSFPMEGTSIAVDMPVSSDIQRIVDGLNEFIIAAGGRVYLTKDRFTRPEHFRAMEPRLPRFQELRGKWDPARRLRSAQSRRLFGDAA
jgi:decaprenylphospho-beta-D-ribofuranose 2-oxidase